MKADLGKIYTACYDKSNKKIHRKTNEDSKEVQTEKVSLKVVPLANGMVKAKTGNMQKAAMMSIKVMPKLLRRRTLMHFSKI